MRHALFAALVALLAVLSLIQLERLRGGVETVRGTLGGSPVSVYRGDAEATGLLVLVSHGFAGSRQMMDAISRTLARAGHVVVSFDYQGHGRNGTAMSRDVTRITGTTEDLVAQTLAVAAAARAQTGLERLALVGHSMATDVVVRAAERLQGVEAVAAISMYSDAVDAAHPARLLIVSGAGEGRLREVALDAVRQLDPAAQEGETARRGDVQRRAVAAPYVGHVGVLWHPLTSREIAGWLGRAADPVRTGPWILALLAALVLLFWPLSRAVPERAAPGTPSARRVAAAALVPALLATGAGLVGWPLTGLAGFGGLALLLSVWGVAALAILRPRWRWGRWDMLAGLLLLGWGLGAFGLALDRYGAAFVPVGPRAGLMAALLVPAILFALGDRALVAGRGPVWRLVLRLPVLAALLGAMALGAGALGLLFTVLPVLVLFWAVYGTMAGWLARRSGPLGPALASGVILAWAIAASTPLFAA